MPAQSRMHPSYQDRSLHLEIEEEEKLCVCSGSPQVLVVDDNIFNIMAVKTLIQSDADFEIECDQALNGRLALEAVEKREALVAEGCRCGKGKANYRLVLMDCNMPVMDGFEATKAIRKYLSEKGAKQPFNVALTAYNTSGFEEKCREAGMDRFLAKPLDYSELKTILTQLFP